MKIRQALVSNSSSSSFIMRGIVIETKKLVEILNLKDIEEENIYQEVECHLSDNHPKLSLESTGYFFDSDRDDSEVVLGINIHEPNDGVAIVIDDNYPDEKVVKELQKVGIPKEDMKDLKTIFWFISNDNY